MENLSEEVSRVKLEITSSADELAKLQQKKYRMTLGNIKDSEEKVNNDKCSMLFYCDVYAQCIIQVNNICQCNSLDHNTVCHFRHPGVEGAGFICDGWLKRPICTWKNIWQESLTGLVAAVDSALGTSHIYRATIRNISGMVYFINTVYQVR